MKVAVPFIFAILLISGCSVIANSTEPTNKVRVASFNVSMEASNYVDTREVDISEKGTTILIEHLATGEHPQIRNIAEIIQRTRPDIVLLNEFDYIDSPEQGIKAFISNYLGKPQNGAEPIAYPYFFYAQSNTGLPTPFDLDNDGKHNKFGADAYGFGNYSGQYAMVLISRYPIINEAIRTFQYFRWTDMPGALIPIEPETNTPFYNEEEWANFRLSSKSHWDIPVNINGNTLHVLASHPTPPVFDGPEDRNGKRNHDEVRLLLDYVTPGAGDYIYDDRGVSGNLPADSRFIIVGDLNASPDRVQIANHPIKQLLSSELINNDYMPRSDSGALNRPDNPYGQYHTASWGARADYSLPSANLKITNSGVFWPGKDDDLYRLVKDRASSSDHYLVWVDIVL